MTLGRTNGTANSVTVGLMWHSLGSGNLGVGALTESNIAIVRGVAERLGLRVRFIVLGTSDATVPELVRELQAAGHDLRVQRIRVFRKEFRETIRQCDLVLDIGEGDSFADIYGFRRFFYFWLSKNIVCSLGKPLVLSPQTIGPFDGALARQMARQVMRRCTQVFARDGLSRAYLAELGIRGNVDESTDVAFRLPFKSPVLTPSDKVRVGINVSGLLFNGGYTGNNQFGLSIDYPATMRKLIAELTSRSGVEVHLIGHVIEPNLPIEDDMRVARCLAIEFRSVTLAPAFKRPADAKSYIAAMDFFVGARMHACIAALSSGVAVVPMAYSRKFNGLFSSLEYTDFADCRVEADTDIVEKVLAGLVNFAHLRTRARMALSSTESAIARYETQIAVALEEESRGRK